MPLTSFLFETRNVNQDTVIVVGVGKCISSRLVLDQEFKRFDQLTLPEDTAITGLPKSSGDIERRFIARQTQVLNGLNLQGVGHTFA